MAIAYHNLGKYTEALKYFKQTLQMQQALHEGESHDDVAIVLRNVGLAHQNLGNHAEALKYYQKARQMQQALE